MLTDKTRVKRKKENLESDNVIWRSSSAVSPPEEEKVESCWTFVYYLTSGATAETLSKVISGKWGEFVSCS